MVGGGGGVYLTNTITPQVDQLCIVGPEGVADKNYSRGEKRQQDFLYCILTIYVRGTNEYLSSYHD